MESRDHFASDACAGICPEVWRALERVNQGHAPSYGEDEWTAHATELLRRTFDTDCAVYFVFSGTAANALALASSGKSHHSVVCHEAAHVAIAECAAPEFFSGGMTLHRLPGALGKIAPAEIERTVARHGHLHSPKPRIVSVTEPTEFGAIYSAKELRSIGETARRYGLRYHMDGARLANAIAALRVTPAELTRDAGVDVLSFGNTKNGGFASEAIVFFDKELALEFAYRRKQAGQLCAKMRFLAATWVGLLEGETWLRHAAHANAMARRLHDRLTGVLDARILFPVETNAVFVNLPHEAVTEMRQRGWRLPALGSETDIRLMCGWDTTEDDVIGFISDLEASCDDVRLRVERSSY